MTISATEQAILANISENQQNQADFLAELVRINSFTENKAGVDRVGQRIVEKLSSIGYEHLPFDSGQEIGLFHHLVPPEGSAKPIVLLGHLDTVFPPDSGFVDFTADGDRLRGPGVFDMKGGLAVVVFALKALYEEGGDVGATILLNSDEEIGSPHSKPWLCERLQKMDAALVFEGGRDGDALITCRKGSGRMFVRTSGRAAHAGMRHHEGINAAVQLCHACIALDELTDYARQVTVNIGVVRGGIAKNVVPESAEALVDFRYVDAADLETLRTEVKSIEATEFVDGATTEIELIHARPPMPRTDEGVELMRRYADASLEVGLSCGEAPLQGGGSDANLAALEGVPVIDGLGPYGGGCHTTDEWIYAQSLLAKTRALAVFLYRWGKL